MLDLEDMNETERCRFLYRRCVSSYARTFLIRWIREKDYLKWKFFLKNILILLWDDSQMLLPVLIFHFPTLQFSHSSGKIFAQPHTIVKQICFPNGDVLFLSLFSLFKNWMHNVVWGCAEILPFWRAKVYSRWTLRACWPKKARDHGKSAVINDDILKVMEWPQITKCK